MVVVLLIAACTSGSTAVPSAQAPINIGLVVSLTGTNSATAELAIQGAMVALARANDSHLAGSRRFNLIQTDDGSGPDSAAAACSRLVAQSHVLAIVGFESKPALDACSHAASAAHVPYFAGMPSGADVCSPLMFVFGFTPNQQVTPLIDFLATQQNAKTFFVVASDTSSARSSVELAALRIHESGGVLLGTLFHAPGARDYVADMAKIAAARPDVVLGALTGDAEIAFGRQLRSDPRLARTKYASLGLDSTAARSIGSGSVGAFVTQDYNSADSSPATRAWLAALMKRFGDGAVPSSFGAEMYDATIFMATALGHAQSTSGEAIASAAGTVSIEGPRGLIHLPPGGHGYATVSAHIGQVNAAYGIDELNVSGPMDPLAC